MAPSLTKALFFLSSLHSVVALPKSSVGVGFGQVSNIQPDSLTGLPSDLLDFQDVSSIGLQRHARVRKAVTSDLAVTTSDLLEIEFEDTTVLGLQQTARVRKAVSSDLAVTTSDLLEIEFEDTTVFGLQQTVSLKQRKPTLSVDFFQSDEVLDTLSLIGLQRSATLLKPSVRVSAKVSTVRRPKEASTRCANVARS